ncbi:hypothetical protein EYF80_001354 [Liparis tanakae]|uniref:Uncharacterized protein n=1 Tax=Liparis tanakae TaxID=230148 RepID=A0A4Z2JEX9_9TELE|nr:hypothetical protein EYF80_001354 [Liparis tanakae]
MGRVNCELLGVGGSNPLWSLARRLQDDLKGLALFLWSCIWCSWDVNVEIIDGVLAEETSVANDVTSATERPL